MVMIQRIVPPNIDDSLSSSDVIVREGSNVTLRCRANGSPTPTVKWKRDSMEKISINKSLVGKYWTSFLPLGILFRFFLLLELQHNDCRFDNCLGLPLHSLLLFEVELNRTIINLFVYFFFAGALSSQAIHALARISKCPLYRCNSIESHWESGKCQSNSVERKLDSSYLNSTACNRTTSSQSKTHRCVFNFSTWQLTTTGWSLFFIVC